MYFENLRLDFWLAASEICYILIHEGDKLDSDDICPRWWDIWLAPSEIIYVLIRDSK